MEDKHLNLFYSYNRDNELIENNLTRSLIVTLRMLSPQTCTLFLQTLLEPFFCETGQQLPNLQTPQFALQSNVKKEFIKKIRHNYVLTIATDKVLEKHPDQAAVYEDSIPDAWIYDPGQEYCFLVEAKVGLYPLGRKQVASHAGGWLGISTNDLENHLLAITWIDVLNVIQEIDAHVMNMQESSLLQEFTQFLGYFGYRLFSGFEFRSLAECPEFMLANHLYHEKMIFLDFSNLHESPGYRLGRITG